MMKRLTYSVADLHFWVEAEESLLQAASNMAPFVIGDDGDDSPILFSVTQTDSLPQAEEEPYFCTDDGPGFPEIAIHKSQDGYLFTFRPFPGRPVAALLATSEDFCTGRLKLTNSSDLFGFNSAMMLIYALTTANMGALQMHSCVVTNDGRGYLFLGRSGTGKSTHGRLWMENIPGTELLNDDNPILRVMPDGTKRVFGSPWSGKTPCYKAASAPVGAVVRLSQAPYNKICRLSPLEAYASLMSSASSFRPFASLAQGWHATLEALVADVPCYTLDCLPDRDAAELCYRTIHG